MAEKEDQVAPDEENDQQKGQTNIVQGGAEPAKVAEVSSDVEDTNQPDAVEGNAVDAKKKKKRKSKKKKTSDQEAGPEESGPTSQDKVDLLLKANPQLESQFAGQNKAKIEELLRKLSVNEMLTGMSVTGKNQKDMASYKFWKTQPVPKFDEKPKGKEGPINPIDPAQTPKEPIQLIPGFEWVVMDMTDENELSDVYELLLGHYVEDDQAMFRFKYSASFLGWALKVPGWHKDWHVGIRATQSRKLVAFISGVPVQLRVRDTVMNGSEINFLCVHKKLRAKRLAPVLIQEITRRCHLVGVQQAIYTAGVVLPRPITTCRYFHRSIDWMKLYEIGFSPLPTGSNPKRQVTKNHIPSTTSVQGMRPMQGKDVEAVHDLLSRYLKRFTLAPVFSKEDIDHLLLHKEKTSPEQVIWTYVVEQPKSHKITDFVSFYCLDSQVIKKKKHDSIHAAYLYYYASAVAFEGTGKDKANKEALKIRLNELIGDALVHAKKLGFDVMNALTLLDNPKFLEQQKFGRGDGQLHYYLYNYRIAPMAGGLNDKGKLDEKRDGELGIVML